MPPPPSTCCVATVGLIGPCCDFSSQRRTPLMHAILSKSEHMVALFMEYSVALRAIDIQWGWTALHCAAHVGMDNVAKSLLGKRASPYATSKVKTN